MTRRKISDNFILTEILKMKFKPCPGIVIIEPLETKSTGIDLGENKSRILKGKIIATGGSLTTDLGEILSMDRYAHVGDIVYFLSYEGNYDNAVIDNKTYFMVKMQDLRTAL